MDWINMVLVRDYSRALVNTVGTFLSGWGTGGLLRRAQVHGDS
jgi:hypothetical protein